MTSPTNAGGGLAVTVGFTAKLLTEYAPVTVINLNTTGRIWLGTSANVSPSTGVPVEPGTSYDWQQSGTLYAILDPAATVSSASVVLTSAGGDWSPSPIAVGVAVATQLLTSGVPVVSRTAVLQPSTVTTAVNVVTTWLNVLGYQAIEIDLTTVGAPTGLLQIVISWSDDNGVTTTSSDYVTSLIAAVAGQHISVPCRANYVFIQINQPSALTITTRIVATTRVRDRIRTTYYGNNTPNVQLAGAGLGATLTVPTGASFVACYALPVEGQTLITIEVPALTGAGAVIAIVIRPANNPNGPASIVNQNFTNTVQTQYQFTIPSPLEAIQISLAQTGTAAINATVSAVRIPI